jgi:hypothetical protein
MPARGRHSKPVHWQTGCPSPWSLYLRVVALNASESSESETGPSGGLRPRSISAQWHNLQGTSFERVGHLEFVQIASFGLSVQNSSKAIACGGDTNQHLNTGKELLTISLLITLDTVRHAKPGGESE